MKIPKWVKKTATSKPVKKSAFGLYVAGALYAVADFGMRQIGGTGITELIADSSPSVSTVLENVGVVYQTSSDQLAALASQVHETMGNYAEQMHDAVASGRDVGEISQQVNDYTDTIDGQVQKVVNGHTESKATTPFNFAEGAYAVVGGMHATMGLIDRRFKPKKERGK